MFIGHLGLSFAAKKSSPRLPLGTSFLAAQMPDVMWPYLLLLGVERVAVAPGDTPFTPLRFEHYLISHSLLLDVVWGSLLGLAYYWRRRDARGGVTVALLVVSHWLLDFVTHRPDLPLVPWSSRVVGLGLWHSVWGTIALEGALFGVGVWLYVLATGGARARGGLALSILVGGLVFLYLTSIISPPPPSPTAVAVVGVISAPLFWLWGNWVDRRREPLR